MRFTLRVNGRSYDVSAHPLTRLLDILREDLELTGTKEGCGEGECGACAVLLDGRLVNACLIPALQLPGRDVVTIEGLGTEVAPDPLQEAFLEEGAVQCGFCIPGMVLAGRALLNDRQRPSRDEIRHALAGNLCRCTGYERIFRAVECAAEWEARGERQSRIAGALAARQVEVAATAAPVMEVAPDDPPVFSPTTVDEALRILQQHGQRLLLIAGGTDLLVDVKLGKIPPGPLLDLSRLRALGEISRDDALLRIGAGVTFADLRGASAVREWFPALSEMASQIGAVAIQNRATVGGNLISASPAADAPPILMALGAQLVLQNTARERRVPIAEFYTGYRETQRGCAELLTRIEIPLPAPDAHAAFYKVGTRRAQAISKVCLGGHAILAEDRSLRDVRLAAGSVAPVPLMLDSVAQLLEGRTLTPETVPELAEETGRAARAAVRPIDDVRSTATYRAETLGNLVGRFLSELACATRGKIRDQARDGNPG